MIVRQRMTSGMKAPSEAHSVWPGFALSENRFWINWVKFTG